MDPSDEQLVSGPAVGLATCIGKHAKNRIKKLDPNHTIGLLGVPKV